MITDVEWTVEATILRFFLCFRWTSNSVVVTVVAVYALSFGLVCSFCDFLSFISCSFNCSSAWAASHSLKIVEFAQRIGRSTIFLLLLSFDFVLPFSSFNYFSLRRFFLFLFYIEFRRLHAWFDFDFSFNLSFAFFVFNVVSFFTSSANDLLDFDTIRFENQEINKEKKNDVRKWSRHENPRTFTK